MGHESASFLWHKMHISFIESFNQNASFLDRNKHWCVQNIAAFISSKCWIKPECTDTQLLIGDWRGPSGRSLICAPPPLRSRQESTCPPVKVSIYKLQLHPLLLFVSRTKIQSSGRHHRPQLFSWNWYSPTHSPGRYVLKIHFFFESGLKMIQFKTKSGIFIQKNIHSIESRIFNRISHSQKMKKIIQTSKIRPKYGFRALLRPMYR